MHGLLLGKFSAPDPEFKDLLARAWGEHFELRKQGIPPPIPGFGHFLNAIARQDVGRGVGADGLSTDISRCIPIYVLVVIFTYMVRIFLSHPIEGTDRPLSWKRIELVGIGKKVGWDTLSDIRWIGLLPSLQKAYT